MRKLTDSTVLSVLAGVVLAMLSLPATADDIVLNLDKILFNVDLNGGGSHLIDLSGSVFALATNANDHSLDALNVNATSSTSALGLTVTNTPGTPFSDDPTPFFNFFQFGAGGAFVLHPGDTVPSMLLDTVTLDPTGFTNAQLVGDYQFRVDLQENGTTLGNQSFTVHVFDSTPMGGGNPVPEANTFLGFGLLLTAGSAGLAIRRRREVMASSA